MEMQTTEYDPRTTAIGDLDASDALDGDALSELWSAAEALILKCEQAKSLGMELPCSTDEAANALELIDRLRDFDREIKGGLRGAKLIRSDCREEYARDEAFTNHPSIDFDADWPFHAIDWSAAADEIFGDGILLNNYMFCPLLDE
jgi:hypothetical protein